MAKRMKILAIGECTENLFSGWHMEGGEGVGGLNVGEFGLCSLGGWGYDEFRTLVEVQRVFGSHVALRMANDVTESVPPFEPPNGFVVEGNCLLSPVVRP